MWYFPFSRCSLAISTMFVCLKFDTVIKQPADLLSKTMFVVSSAVYNTVSHLSAWVSFFVLLCSVCLRAVEQPFSVQAVMWPRAISLSCASGLAFTSQRYINTHLIVHSLSHTGKGLVCYPSPCSHMFTLCLFVWCFHVSQLTSNHSQFSHACCYILPYTSK